jgi:serine/threonine-protein kinase
VHRDLKPSNIILVPEDDHNYIVKLVDFGVGKIVPGVSEVPGALEPARDVEDVTRAGLLLGSPRYMSPEQIRSKPVELRTDLYALGVILFQALTGRLPFEAQNEVDLLMAHCLAPAPKVVELYPDAGFPESLSSLVAGMLEKRPEDRPTVEEFLDELALIEDEVFGSVNLAGPTLQSLMPTSVSGSRRRMDSIIPGSTRQVIPSLSATSSWRDRQEASLPQGSTLAPTAAAQGTVAAKRWRLVVLALALAALPLLFWLLLRSPTASTHSTPSASLSATLAAASAAPLPPAAPRATTFALTLESQPSRASVSEDGVVLGRTPLALTIEHESVAQKPRRFILRREGYAPYAVEQGDSDVPVNVSLKLVPQARSGAANGGARAPRGPAAPGASKEAPALKRNDAPSLDIRLRR